MSQFSRNNNNNFDVNSSYQYNYDDVSSSFGREKVTIYNRSITKRGDKKKRKVEAPKSFKDNAMEFARYMGMGVYMTSTAFPSPFLPVNDTNLYNSDATYYERNLYTMSKIW